jgi:hypothetical protein
LPRQYHRRGQYHRHRYRQLQELERVNVKQAKRLREAEVVLELQKKSKRFGGAKDDDTTKG